MSLLQAIILGIIEGLTEFLPVSSTGHMVVAEALMGMQSTTYVKAFTVIIQLGAILSIVCLYFRRFFSFSIPEDMKGPEVSEWRRFLSRFRFYLNLIVGVIPAVILGLLFNSWVDKMLGAVWVIAVDLILGGIVMIFIDRLIRNNHKTQVTYHNAFVIGLFQCIAIFLPGTSRSMATIVGGMAQGLTRKAAAEFSFLLAVPTMFGATLLEVYKLWKTGGSAIFIEHADTLLVGNVVSFIVALFAVKGFVAFLTKYGFKSFGVYRIIIGSFILILIALGYNLATI